MGKFVCGNKCCGKDVDVINSSDYVTEDGKIYCNIDCLAGKNLPSTGLRRVKKSKYKKERKRTKWVCPVCGRSHYMRPHDNLCVTCKKDENVDRGDIVLRSILVPMTRYWS